MVLHKSQLRIGEYASIIEMQMCCPLKLNKYLCFITNRFKWIDLTTRMRLAIAVVFACDGYVLYFDTCSRIINLDMSYCKQINLNLVSVHCSLCYFCWKKN